LIHFFHLVSSAVFQAWIVVKIISLRFLVQTVSPAPASDEYPNGPGNVRRLPSAT